VLDSGPNELGLIWCSVDDVHGTEERVDCEAGNVEALDEERQITVPQSPIGNDIKNGTK